MQGFMENVPKFRQSQVGIFKGGLNCLREPVYFFGKEEDCCVEIDTVFMNPDMFITGAFSSYYDICDCCLINHSTA